MPANVSKLLLRKVPLFAMLPEHQLDVLAARMRRRSFSRGSTIISAGDVTDSLYLVISGKLKVIISDDAGHEIILSMLGPNEYFGEMVPIDDSPRSASVIALGPCDLLMLSKNEFRKSLSESFEMTLTVMRCLIQRLREADRKISNLALMDVYGRVVRHLQDMSEVIGGQKVVTQKIVKQEMARMIGASREMVSRVMKDLQSRGLIELRGKVLYLRDNMESFD
jgi:CRP/FNR family transcriptional regulator, cyclic AMP receptor protein